MTQKNFGQWLKEKLKQHNVLQQELAKQICVAENTVTSWSTGVREPSIRNFMWICRYIAVLDDVELHVTVMEASEYF
jgi:transcriptional regulator with XRE-family HTH domain